MLDNTEPGYEPQKPEKSHLKRQTHLLFDNSLHPEQEPRDRRHFPRDNPAIKPLNQPHQHLRVKANPDRVS